MKADESELFVLRSVKERWIEKFVDELSNYLSDLNRDVEYEYLTLHLESHSFGVRYCPT